MAFHGTPKRPRGAGSALIEIGLVFRVLLKKEFSVKFNNRITQMLGVDIPIVQAPMGWIARVSSGFGSIQSRSHGDY